MSTYTMNTSIELWPGEFRPERWLIEDAAKLESELYV
jgi:hypothetical protein